MVSCPPPAPRKPALRRKKTEKTHWTVTRVCSLRSHGTNKGANSTILALALDASLSSAVFGDTCWLLLLAEIV